MTIMKFLPVFTMVLAMSHAAVATAVARAGEGAQEPPGGDVIARVGDQDITFNQINTMLNSSAVVGVSLPALGTPERDTARITVLDKVISANLLYLDALAQGLDRDPGYLRQVERFSSGTLASAYRQRDMVGEVAVSDAEIQQWYEANILPENELTDALRTQIEATLRKEKLQARLAQQRKQLRAGIDVTLYQGNLDRAGDEGRADDVVLAEFDGEVITWGELGQVLVAAEQAATARDPLAMETEARLGALQAAIDRRIMASKARAAGLDKDPLYRMRLDEFGKTLLVNLHRQRLAESLEPSDEALQAYFDANRDRIMLRELRKVQEIVLESREDAEAIRQRIVDGELTLYQAAAQYSIAPGAKQNLGEIGWVAEGRAQPALDAMIFALEPGEIGGPAESTAGWHLVLVQDVKEARFVDLADAETRRLTRRKYIHDKLDEYVVALRKNGFPVTVYEDRLVALAQQEADMVGRLAEQAAQPGSQTEQRLGEFRELIKP
jgi:peptidyl-prolyl cis-trans isomerase C